MKSISDPISLVSVHCFHKNLIGAISVYCEVSTMNSILRALNKMKIRSHSALNVTVRFVKITITIEITSDLIHSVVKIRLELSTVRVRILTFRMNIAEIIYQRASDVSEDELVVQGSTPKLKSTTITNFREGKLPREKECFTKIRKDSIINMMNSDLPIR
jgi:hypothetical protein